MWFEILKSTKLPKNGSSNTILKTCVETSLIRAIIDYHSPAVRDRVKSPILMLFEILKTTRWKKMGSLA